MATAGSVSGTRWIVLKGGPPEWDGRATAIYVPAQDTLGPPRTLERWCHTADLVILYERTDFETEIVVARHTREGGTKRVDAEVWEYAGYKFDLLAA